MLITIDGPSGAGKSTVSRALAKILSYPYLDTGALYRAIAYKITKEKAAVEDTSCLTRLLDSLNLKLEGKAVQPESFWMTSTYPIFCARKNLVCWHRVFQHCRSSGRCCCPFSATMEAWGASLPREGTWAQWFFPMPTSSFFSRLVFLNGLEDAVKNFRKRGLYRIRKPSRRE